MTNVQDSAWFRHQWLRDFPWDWAETNRDIANTLLDHWEGGNTGPRWDPDVVNLLRDTLAQYPSQEQWQVRDEVLSIMKDQWGLDSVEAVATWLRGKRSCAEAQRIQENVETHTVEQEVEESLELMRSFEQALIAHGDKELLRNYYGTPWERGYREEQRRRINRDRESLKELWKAAADDYRRACDLEPSAALAVTAGRIYLLELKDIAAAREMYTTYFENGLRYMVLEDEDQQEYFLDNALGCASGLLVDAGLEPLDPEGYGSPDPRFAQEPEAQKMLLQAARTILEPYVEYHVGDISSAPPRLDEILAPEVSMIALALFRIHEHGIPTVLDYLFNDLDVRVKLQLIIRQGQQTQRSLDQNRRDLAKSRLRTSFGSYWSSFDPQLLDLLVDTELQKERALSEGLDPSNWAAPMAKALERVLHTVVALRLAKSAAGWPDAPRNRTEAVPPTLWDLGSFSNFFRWATQSQAGRRLFEEDLGSRFGGTGQLRLAPLNRLRTLAIHDTDEPMARDQADEFYRAVMGGAATGRSLIVELYDLFG